MTQAVELDVTEAPAPFAFTVEADDGAVYSFVVAAEPAPVQLTVTGEVGPPGPQGATGPRGPSGSAPVTYIFSGDAATWTVAHNLGRIPQVQLVADTGEQFDGDVEFPDLNTVVITHASPRSGSVLVS